MTTQQRRTFQEYLDEERRRWRIAQGLPPEPLPPMPGLLAVPTGTSKPPPVPFIYGPNDPRGMQERAFTPTDIPGIQRLVDILAPETIPYGPFKGRLNPFRVLGAAFTTPDPDIAARLQQEPAILKVLMGLPVGAPVRSIAGTAGRGVLTQTGRAATQAAEKAAPVARRLALEEAGAIRLTRTETVNLADLRKRLSMPGGLNDRDYALLQRLEARQATPAAPTSISRQEAITRSQRQIQAAEEGRKAVAEAEAARGLEPVVAGQAEMFVTTMAEDLVAQRVQHPLGGKKPYYRVYRSDGVVLGGAESRAAALANAKKSLQIFREHPEWDVAAKVTGAVGKAGVAGKAGISAKEKAALTRQLKKAEQELVEVERGVASGSWSEAAAVKTRTEAAQYKEAQRRARAGMSSEDVYDAFLSKPPLTKPAVAEALSPAAKPAQATEGVKLSLEEFTQHIKRGKAQYSIAFDGVDVTPPGMGNPYLSDRDRIGSAYKRYVEGAVELPQAPVGAKTPEVITPGRPAVAEAMAGNAPTGVSGATDQGNLLPGSAAPPVKPPIEPPVATGPWPPREEPPRPGVPLPGMERPPLGDNIIGLREITTGLTRGERAQNVAIAAGRKARLPLQLNNEYGTAAMREKSRVAPNINSQATQLAHRQAVGIRQAFPDLQEDLFVPSLEGKVSRVKGAPAIQDIADFYPGYEPFLTAAQKTALAPIIESNRAYLDLLNKVGLGVKSRPSTLIGGGDYIPRVARGLLAQEDIRGAPTRGLFASERKGFEQEISFETAAAGRAAGIKYAGIEDALNFHYRQAGQRATEQHIANYLTTVTDAANWPISVPQRGELTMGRKMVDLPVLADVSFPDAVANSINKILVNEGRSIGQGRLIYDAVKILNQGYRTVRATLDNSFQGIQGLLSAYAHPIASAKAAKLNFLSWKDPTVLARFNESFDANAVRNGRLTIQELVAEAGLHQGAVTGEFITEGLMKLHGFKQAGRAYGYTGDGLRSLVTDALLEQEMHGYRIFGLVEIGKGRTLADIRASGDLAKIGEIANNMTGVARGRFGGDIGEFLLFAPRFFESRLETIAKGMMGLRPGASIEQKIARRSLLKMIAIGTTLTVALNELNGQETDFRPIVNGRKNPNFMRVRLLGRDWSLFGTWDSMVGLLIAAGHADAEGVLRSQASGIVTTAWDLLSGSDFLGRSTRSAENIALYIMRQILPFSGENVAQATETALSGRPADIVGGVAAAASSLEGLKSSPLSFSDHADQILRSRGPAWGGVTWASLSAARKTALQAAEAQNKTTSPEYSRLDDIMDRLATEVERLYPQQAVPTRLTMSAKREELAQRLYNRSYSKLYPNQRVKINKRIQAARQAGTMPQEMSQEEWMRRAQGEAVPLGTPVPAGVAR